MTDLPEYVTRLGEAHRLVASGAAAGLPMPLSTRVPDWAPIELMLSAHGYAAWCEWATEVHAAEGIHDGRVVRRARCSVGDVRFDLAYVSDPIEVAS